MFLQEKTWEETWGTVDWKRPNMAIQQVSSFLKMWTDTEIKDPKGETVFMKAALTGNLKSCALLLKAGANINAVNNEGKSTLILAIEQHRHRNTCAFVKKLIGAGTDINLQDKGGNNALMHAVMQRLHSVIQVLIDHKSDLNQENYRQETALALALKGRDEVATVMLLNAGASSGNPWSMYVPKCFRERVEQGVGKSPMSPQNTSPYLVAKQSGPGKDHQNKR